MRRTTRAAARSTSARRASASALRSRRRRRTSAERWGAHPARCWALTDIGFAEAVAKKLAESDEAHYGEAAKRLTIKAARAAERRKELKQHEKNVRTGKKKPHQEEPQPAPAAKAKSAEKSESKRPRGAVKHGRTRAEREKAHRAAEKQRAARRFAHSRPVKKGKGSIKKDSKQRSQHTEVQ